MTNLLFQTRKPRRFHHEPIYSDERRERLKELKLRAEHELAEESDSRKASASGLPESGSTYSPRVGHAIHFGTKRRHGTGMGFQWLTVMMAVILLLLFIVILITIL
jgi:hypothetical protein